MPFEARFHLRSIQFMMIAMPALAADAALLEVAR